MPNRASINPEHPCWRGYRGILARLGKLDPIPGAQTLTRLLPPGTVNQQGLPVRFVPAREVGPANYEEHIYLTGQVSTREDNWHDLFNALVWCRLPCLKAAMNARHFQHRGAAVAGSRGRIRDALTLFDESGVIVTGPDKPLLEAIAQKDWNAAFVNRRERWYSSVRVLVCGHAILEKFLNPYRSVTAHALLLQAVEPLSVRELDKQLARSVSAGGLLDAPSCLAPLPLMGIPGWWRSGAQDEAFYADRDVFRPAGKRKAAPVHDFSAI